MKSSFEIRGHTLATHDGTYFVLSESGSNHSRGLKQPLRLFDVAARERFARANVDILRRGQLHEGLEPSELQRVLSSVAATDLAAETLVEMEHLRDG